MRLIGQPEDIIVTVTLNPSMDRILSVAEFHPRTLHLAGLLWAITDQCNPITTTRRAVSCGTADAMQIGTGLGDRALI